jgi:hypothetical protein
MQSPDVTGSGNTQTTSVLEPECGFSEIPDWLRGRTKIGREA